MLFIITLRGKLGIVCILGSFMYVIANMISGGLTIGETLSQSWILLLFMIMLGISFLIPDIVYLATPAKETWDRWGLALRKYKFDDYKFVTFDGFYPSTRCAVTRDIYGAKLNVTLIQCTCRDCRKNKTPCIHMHKLADMLGVHD